MAKADRLEDIALSGRSLPELTRELATICGDMDYQLIRANAAMEFLQKHGDEDLHGMVAIVQPFLDQMGALTDQMRGSMLLVEKRAQA